MFAVDILVGIVMVTLYLSPKGRSYLALPAAVSAMGCNLVIKKDFRMSKPLFR